MNPLYLQALFVLFIVCSPVFALCVACYLLEAFVGRETKPSDACVISPNGYVLCKGRGNYVPSSMFLAHGTRS